MTRLHGMTGDGPTAGLRRLTGRGKRSCGLVGLLLLTLSSLLAAQPTTSAAPAALERAVAQRSVNEWLIRMHTASRSRAYVGTFVVSAGDSISSSRIWHVCDGEQQVERIESLTGAPRSTYRRNDQVITFLPQSRVAIAERRESLGLFPYLLQADDSTIARYYRVTVAGSERVAGIEADKVQLWSRDGLRYGYRVWTEKDSGLVLKLQTLDSVGHVLEQAAFSELQLDVPVNLAKLTLMMDNTVGYTVEKPEMMKIAALSEGWVLRTLVPGFESMSCYKRLVRTAGGASSDSTLQWVFSDGLASVSLFVEPFDARRRAQPGVSAIGATHTLTRRIGDWWLTAVGEVPAQTLTLFAQGLERTR